MSCQTEVHHESSVGQTRCALDTGAHSLECRARFDIVWTKELPEAETASRAADSIPSGPDVRELELLKSTEATGQLVAMEEVITNQVVERDGKVSRQLDENQLEPMDVSLDQNATTVATKQRAGTQLTPNNVEGGIGGLRSFDGHQAEQAEKMFAN